MNEFYSFEKRSPSGRTQKYVQGQCKQCTKARTTELNRKAASIRAARARAAYRSLRESALEVYGSSCHICGERELTFLCIDHIRDDGASNRKGIAGKFRSFYAWLKHVDYPEGLQTLCENCNFKKEMSRREMTQSKQIKKRCVMLMYGGECACCGQSDPQTLQIDHVNGNGSAHRKTIRAGDIYAFLAARDVSPDYQILCANCNRAKQVLGACPHYVARRFDTMLIIGLC